MNKYEIIVYWSQTDDAFIAEVPELPGCVADGNSPIDAIKNVNTIIDEWIETANQTGREIPKPKGRLMFA
ncbi:MAG: type II toxin-antitoxin system HicB family antitoxin [Porphyromonadaceae bacterium]|nr:MAG: type II toxin-antitoxin system HicB family antitoxin [Porphyromonadaceae bacterium]